MAEESFGQRALSKTKRFMKRLLLIVIVIGIAVFSFMYWATYEDGVMAGKVIRISQQGVIFKTYEGKLNLETFGALKGTSPIAESFDFSVVSGQENLVKTLQEVSLSGERVNLYYSKRYMRFPWRGQTKTFVTKVERLKSAP